MIFPKQKKGANHTVSSPRNSKLEIDALLRVGIEQMYTISLKGNLNLVAHLCGGRRIHASGELLAADHQEQVGLGAERLNVVNRSGELVLRIVIEAPRHGCAQDGCP